MAKDKPSTGGGKSSFSKVSPGKAKQIVDKAAQEANDVIHATQSDPLKTTKKIKGAVKEDVAKLVESGDPGQVVQYIKSNRKEFISGVYMSWFMKEVRAQLEGGAPKTAASAKPAAKPAKPAAKPAAKTAAKPAAKAGKAAEKSKGKDKKAVSTPEKRKKKQVSSSSENSDSASGDESEDEKPAAKRPKQVAASTSKRDVKPDTSKTEKSSDEAPKEQNNKALKDSK